MSFKDNLVKYSNEIYENYSSVVAGAGLSLVSTPIATTTLALFGFTKGGIVAGSLAASMMSSAAVASGGGIAAGSTVAVCQSVAATGVAVSGPVGWVLGGGLTATIVGVKYYWTGKF